MVGFVGDAPPALASEGSNLAATVYFVSPSGSDANSGTEALPFKTVAKGISVAQPGDEVRLQPGTYQERLDITNKHGTPEAPILVVGASYDPAAYPIIDGGDPGFSGGDDPAFYIKGSSWLVFERLAIRHSTKSCFTLDASSYIVIRRTLQDYHTYGVLSRNSSHHLLLEYNEIYQSYGELGWTDLKSSKWEGGAYVSFGGAGMVTIRHNYFHDTFNAVILYSGSRTQQYQDANVWIYRNRFERIVDDPYEPESFALNNHFFHNTLIDTHRMTSAAPIYLGPVYVYANIQLLTFDITREADTGRRNSALKVEMGDTYPANGLYFFNNSLDLSVPGTNGYGLDLLDSTIHNLFHYNNAYRTEKPMASNVPTLVNAEVDFDLSLTKMNVSEAHGTELIEPGFQDPAHENFRLKADAAARAHSRPVVLTVGFGDPVVIPEGADAGAYPYGESDFHRVPEPVYVAPPGGEPESFGTVNLPWPADVRGGVNPPDGPNLPQGDLIFADVVADYPLRGDIEALYQAGYTAGCTTDPLRFCPEQTMNRAESAVFVERGIHTAAYDPPAPAVQVFADVPLDSWAAKWVNGLWGDQFTSGCGSDPLVFCPWQANTRAEGSVFFLRMLRGPGYSPPRPATQTFADVPLDTWFAPWVEMAYQDGLIPPCATSPDLRFCPNDPLTRAMAAHMMVQARGLRDAELAGGVMATFEVYSERFELWATNPQTIQQLLSLGVPQTQRGFPSGPVLRGSGQGGRNYPWSWHLDPEATVITGASIELCDGMPSYVESHIDEFVDRIGYYCPWGARLVRLEDFR
jgi:hypothetical protein